METRHIQSPPQQLDVASSSASTSANQKRRQFLRNFGGAALALGSGVPLFATTDGVAWAQAPAPVAPVAAGAHGFFNVDEVAAAARAQIRRAGAIERGERQLGVRARFQKTPNFFVIFGARRDLPAARDGAKLQTGFALVPFSRQIFDD